MSPSPPKLMVENNELFPIKSEKITRLSKLSGGKGELAYVPTLLSRIVGGENFQKVQRRGIVLPKNKSTPPGPGLEPGGHALHLPQGKVTHNN